MRPALFVDSTFSPPLDTLRRVGYVGRAMNRPVHISENDLKRLHEKSARENPWKPDAMRCSWLEWCLLVLSFAILLLLVLTPFRLFRFGWFVPVANGLGLVVLVAALANLAVRIVRRVKAGASARRQSDLP